MLVPLHAEEATGLNKIPLALAARYADALGLKVDTGIVQANRPFHTGANAMERLVPVRSLRIGKAPERPTSSSMTL
ncbi:MAG: hypothetical protein M3447_00190 [Acidobacteriota bacterium]|nr:hypothetical protein [Acidobacteriota bacterium]